MKKIMPQELEVWYLIPALRKEIAKIFIEDYNLNQKRVAEILGITEAAISQYLNSKRGNELKFNKDELKQIKKSAREIIESPANSMRILYGLCVTLRGTKVICELHKNLETDLPKNCDVCFK
ncbi:MAG: transcriptional regulator [Nanoarchaeota archaeon]